MPLIDHHGTIGVSSKYHEGVIDFSTRGVCALKKGFPFFGILRNTAIFSACINRLNLLQVFQ